MPLLIAVERDDGNELTRTERSSRNGDPILLTPHEAADALGVSTNLVLGYADPHSFTKPGFSPLRKIGDSELLELAREIVNEKPPMGYVALGERTLIPGSKRNTEVFTWVRQVGDTGRETRTMILHSQTNNPPRV